MPYLFHANMLNRIEGKISYRGQTKRGLSLILLFKDILPSLNGQIFLLKPYDTVYCVHSLCLSTSLPGKFRSLENFVLRRDKSRYWKSTNALIVADLHLEKGSHYIRGGQMTPPPMTQRRPCDYSVMPLETGGQRVIALGDSFHYCAGPARLSDDQLQFLQETNILWITGNHDADLALSTIIGGKTVDKYVEESFVFYIIMGRIGPLFAITGPLLFIKNQ